MTAQRKTEKLNLRITEESLLLITKAAEICGKSITGFITEASLYSAQKELLDQRFIGLDSSIFDTIDEKLLSEGKCYDKLIKLFKNEREWID